MGLAATFLLCDHQPSTIKKDFLYYTACKVVNKLNDKTIDLQLRIKRGSNLKTDANKSCAKKL